MILIFYRYLVRLKSYVRNKACPEGSIAEGYIIEETLTFAARYLGDDVETKLNRPPRQVESDPAVVETGFEIFAHTCRLIGAGINTNLTPEEFIQAHTYVLFNCEAIRPYIT